MRATLAALVLVCLAVAPAAGQQPSAPNETASQFYLRYRAAVPAATTVQQITSFWSASQRREFDAAPAGDRPGLDEIKAIVGAVSAVKVVKEFVATNAATIEAEASRDGKPVRATVRLTRETDGWKVASGPEQWR